MTKVIIQIVYRPIIIICALYLRQYSLFFDPQTSTLLIHPWLFDNYMVKNILVVGQLKKFSVTFILAEYAGCILSIFI